MEQMLVCVRVRLWLALGIQCRLVLRRDRVAEDAVIERPWCFAHEVWEVGLDPLDEVVDGVDCRVESRRGIVDEEEPNRSARNTQC